MCMRRTKAPGVVSMSRWLAFLLFVFGGACSLQANESAENPFHEGLERVKLNEDQKNVLKQFTESSVTRLRRALGDALGKTFSEARDIYLKATAEVVIDSARKIGPSETLLRSCLNQGLA